MPATYLAADIGATSGRVVAADFDGASLALEETHRFDTSPVPTPQGLFVDALAIHREIVEGLRRAAPRGPRSVAIDTWGVTPALLTGAWTLAGNPVHYRDPRVVGVAERMYEHVPKAELYAATGIQELPFNTGFMLRALADEGLLDGARHMLMLPDLLAMWLGGEPGLERTNASTTQLYDPATGDWSDLAISAMGLPRSLFGTPIVEPGQRLGRLHGSVLEATGLSPDVQVVATASHDTAASVAAVPAEGSRWAYISSGTWSLMGVERAMPLKTPQAMAANLTNEVGVGGTIRLLRNVMGLWLVEESRRLWAREGREFTSAELAEAAAAVPPFGPLVNPDDRSFLAPGDIPARIRKACAATGQPGLETPGEVIRCALESLAQRYRQVLGLLERTTGETVDAVHVVGGGSRNRLLCQLTADACDRPVIAGPAESTAMGNALVQLIADGEAASLAEIREIARRSSGVERYEPAAARARQAEADARFDALAPVG